MTNDLDHSTDDETSLDRSPLNIKEQWGGGAGENEAPFFLPEELDIYVNKVTMDAYVFHGKKVDYTHIDHVIYYADDYSVYIIYKDGHAQNLGVKIQWMIRPYFAQAQEISIVQTRDGDSIDGIIVPLKHEDKKNAS